MTTTPLFAAEIARTRLHEIRREAHGPRPSTHDRGDPA
jgi:hypothetical protein